MVRALLASFGRVASLPIGSPRGSRYARSEAADGGGRDTDLVERSIAVLEEYLRRTAGVSRRNGADSRSDRSQITHAPAQSQKNGHQGNGHDGETGSLLMSEAEAFEVLGLALARRNWRSTNCIGV